MNKIHILVYFICLLFFYDNSVYAYQKPAHVDTGVWNQLTPHFLPEDHPIKAKLDTIFSARATQNTASLKKAGFIDPEPRKYSRTVVTRHPRLKGFVIKLYTDDSPLNDAFELLLRVTGANYTRDAINRFGYQSIFAVPKKWIYPLPESRLSTDGSYPKNFILIAEDMNVLERSDNYYWWKSGLVTKKILDALYMIVQEAGLDDSVMPSNIPFTKDGKIAFVDTPCYHRWPVGFDRLTRHLSPAMRKHWSLLISKNGPS